MSQQQTDRFIAKPEVSFWIPIITSSVLLALSYGALLSRISLVEQKQDQIILTLSEINEKMMPLYTRVGLAEGAIKVLESKHMGFIK